MIEEIHASFRRTAHDFESLAAGGSVPCPPYLVAFIASERVRPGVIELPDGYDEETLYRIRSMTGALGQTVSISPRQAAELAEIGEQILVLRDDQLDEPLTRFEREAVAHLVKLASA